MDNKLRWALAIVLLLLLPAGCGGGKGAPASSGGKTDSSSSASPSKKTGAAAKADADEAERERSLMKDNFAAQVKQISGAHDAIEKDLVRTLSAAIGKEPMDAKKKPIALSECIARLRTAGMKIAIVPLPDPTGGFFKLDDKAVKDFYTKKKRRLTDPEQEAFDALNQMLGTLSNLTAQAQQFSLMAHFMVISHAGFVVNLETYYAVPQSEVDVEAVRNSMSEERRSETMAAASAGLSAAIQVILDQNKDPKKLDEIAKSFIGATPIKANVSTAEAKAFLDGFQGGLGDARKRYEGMLDQYMPEWKKLEIGRYFNDAFKLAESSANRKSKSQERAARGQPDPGAGAGASTPKKTEPAGGGGGGGGAGGVLAGVANKLLLPSDDRVKFGLQTFEALKKGDAKTIATTALQFVPEGPVKMGLGLVLKLF